MLKLVIAFGTPEPCGSPSTTKIHKSSVSITELTHLLSKTKGIVCELHKSGLTNNSYLQATFLS